MLRYILGRSTRSHTPGLGCRLRPNLVIKDFVSSVVHDQRFWYSAWRQEITRIRFKSIFNSINHVRAQAARDREHGWYISLHYVEVVHFTHNSRKSSEEHCTQPHCADQAQYHTSEVWLHRDATRPLQRFPNLYYPLRFQAKTVITLSNEAVP